MANKNPWEESGFQEAVDKDTENYKQYHDEQKAIQEKYEAENGRHVGVDVVQQRKDLGLE